MARRDENRVRFSKNLLVKNKTTIVNWQLSNMRCPLTQDIAQIGICRAFDDNAFLPINNQLCDQIKGVLGSQCHQNLLWTGFDSATRQAARANVIDQHWIVIHAKITNHGAKISHAECLSGAIAPFRHWKQFIIDLPIDEWIGILTPIQRLLHRVNIGAGLNQLAIPVNHAVRGTSRLQPVRSKMGKLRDWCILTDHVA